MPLPLPNLDDLTWEDLLDEARARIPAHAPEWTDFNPSDPGITLLELFAYHVETLIYRLNRVRDSHRHEFLRLVNGPQWTGTGDLAQDLTETLTQLRQKARAVTTEDYEQMATEAIGPRLARVKCIAGKNLERGRYRSSAADAAGDVSLIAMAPGGGTPEPGHIEELKRVLDAARLLGTRVRIVGPRFIDVNFRFRLIVKRGARPREVAADAAAAIRKFFSPEPSADSPGWQFGREVYISEVYATLDGIRGVNWVTKAPDATGRGLDEAWVAESETRRLRRNANGDLSAVALDPDELVRAIVDEQSFRIEMERSA